MCGIPIEVGHNDTMESFYFYSFIFHICSVVRAIFIENIDAMFILFHLCDVLVDSMLLH